MKEDEIKKIVLQILKKIAPDTNPESLNEHDNIREVLAIDSFDYLQFIVGLDNELRTKIPEDDYGKIQTLNEIIKYIIEKMKVN